ncbi:TetR/AcrR family transcriptional regulator [Amycolatopsis sp. TNS106]|uniref:TetR/AcrR family transcriptional regulator n=1 Tax=Amycolatopsis sp. TNS106 TaxID=2861750 RepID=UPI001C569C63|nr:TetR/AcrR family transcriptional regulator [Amycolatopsis sp. TNS106]QXV56329.1 TetR family transcriptional regulator [Amycolatopsis sp. TNS106]
MARTKQQQREETMEALTATARRLFAEHGYGKVGLETIAQTAGVSKGALYHHFSSKAELFRHVLGVVQHDVGEQIARAADAAPDSWAGLLAGCRAFLTAATDPDTQQIMLLDGPSVVGWQDWRELDEESSARHLAEALTELMTGGVLAERPVEPLVRLLSGAMNEAAVWLAHSPDPKADLAATMDTLTPMIEALRLPASLPA